MLVNFLLDIVGDLQEVQVEIIILEIDKNIVNYYLLIFMNLLLNI